MALGDIFSAAGDLLSGFSGSSANKASAKGYKKAAGYARANAEEVGKFADQNAVWTKNAADINILRQQREMFQKIGGAYSDVAGNGLAFSGSALDVIKSSKANAALDVAVMQQNSGRDIFKIQQQGRMDVNDWLQKAESYDAQATAAKQAAKGSALGGILGAASSIFSFF